MIGSVLVLGLCSFIFSLWYKLEDDNGKYKQLYLGMSVASAVCLILDAICVVLKI